MMYKLFLYLHKYFRPYTSGIALDVRNYLCTYITIWRIFIDRSANQPGHEILNFAQGHEIS